MNVLHTILESPAAQRLGWTLLHFLWQGAAGALGLRILLTALRRRSAAELSPGSCAGRAATRNNVASRVRMGFGEEVRPRHRPGG